MVRFLHFAQTGRLRTHLSWSAACQSRNAERVEELSEHNKKKKKIIALKGTVWDFLQSYHCTANCLPTRMLKWSGRNCVQITCNTSSACHVQLAACHLVQRDSSAIKFDRVEIAFILALSLLAEAINRWRGGNRSTQRKAPTRSFRKCHILKPENSSPKRDSTPHSSIGDRLGKQTC